VSFVSAQPDVLSAACGQFGRFGDAMRAGNAAAAAPTTGLAPAASDIVSAMTAAQFGQTWLGVSADSRPGGRSARDSWWPRCAPARGRTH